MTHSSRTGEAAGAARSDATLATPNELWGDLPGAADDSLSISPAWNAGDGWDFDDRLADSTNCDPNDTNDPCAEAAGDNEFAIPTAAEVAALITQLAPSAVPATPATQRPNERALLFDLAPLGRSIGALDAELRAALADDVSRCLTTLRLALADLTSDPADAVSLGQVWRELHTLKGAAASVGLSELATQLHELEDRLRDAPPDTRVERIEGLVSKLQRLATALHPATGRAGHSPADVDTDDREPAVQLRLSQINRLTDSLTQCMTLPHRRRVVATAPRIATGLIPCPSVDGLAAEEQALLTQPMRALYRKLTELKQVPFSRLLRRLQRTADSVATAECKDVRLILASDDVAIDPMIQQRLSEPLMHLVRNAVCHGIESPDQRAADGKPMIGTISLRIKLQPDLLVIEIHDDGRGLDDKAIRRRGIEMGLWDEDQQPERGGLTQLIFHPGLSTRPSADLVAGRGVGMDVVAVAVQRMRGRVEIDSQPSHGTCIRLILPAHPPIQQVMIFHCGVQAYALPLHWVLAVDQEQNAAPLWDLREELGGSDQSRRSRACRRIFLAIPTGIGADRHTITLRVDDIIGTEEVVIRPLPDLLSLHPWFSGLAVSAQGETILMIDGQQFFSRAC